MSLVNCNVHADAWNLRGMPLRHVPAAGQVRLCPAVILPDPVNLQHNVFETAGLHGAGISHYGAAVPMQERPERCGIQIIVTPWFPWFRPDRYSLPDGASYYMYLRICIARRGVRKAW